MAVRAALSGAPARIAAIDALRGIAIVAMVAYHFSFDLALFRFVRFDFERDPLWVVARAAILGTFMLLVGVSLVLAYRQRVPPARRWRRIAVIAACALLVSAASYAMFPRTWISFGVLHAIAVSSVLAWPLVERPRLALGLGIAVLVATAAFTHPAFDSPWLRWIGFATRPPPTEDYVPLFPWLGVTLAGIAAGDAITRGSFGPVGHLARAPEALRWLGRHSLAVYLIHQPVLIGALAIALGRLP